VRIRSLYLPEFKNFRGFRLPSAPAGDSDTRSELGDSEPIIMLLGQNGTGKSNLLEALLTIFRDLDLGNKTMFPYDSGFAVHRPAAAQACWTSVISRVVGVWPCPG
jgi:predicted ATPase